MADIFISYSQKDRDIVAPLAVFLESQGFSVWWDTHLTGGVEFRREIELQLAAARAVIVVWSANAIASNFVLDEASTGAKSSRLVPVREASFAPDYIPLGFRQLHAEVASDRDAVLRALSAKKVAPSRGAEVAQSSQQGALGTSGRGWMWWSTHESIAAEVPSVWAIVETVLAVAAYWAISIYFETYALLLAGVAAAPLVLLRSDASVEQGLLWFEEWEAGIRSGWRKLPMRSSVSHALCVTGSAVIAGAVFMFARTFPNLAFGGWEAIYFGPFGLFCLAILAAVWAGKQGVRTVARIVALLTIVLAVAVFASLIYDNFFIARTEISYTHEMERLSREDVFLIILPLLLTWAGIQVLAAALGLAGALTLISGIVRAAAVARHLIRGICSMPRNFRRLVLSTSPKQAPELIPNL